MVSRNIKKLVSSILSISTILSCVGTVYAGGLNVQVHMGYEQLYPTEAVLKRVDEIGVKWVRDAVTWNSVEKTKGVYDFEGIEDWVTDFTDKGFGALIQLSNGNTLYGSAGGYYIPKASEPEIQDGFANYAQAVASHYNGRQVAYEIWNEPDLERFNLGGATAEDYAALLKKVYPKIKEADPDAMVIAGAFITSTADNYGIDWMKKVLAAGGGAYMDGMSMHIYYHNEGGPDYGNYRSYLYKADTMLDFAGYPDMPIWVSETGYYTGTSENAKTQEQQAAMAIKASVIFDGFLKSTGRDGKMFWYDLQNDGGHADVSEENFGLFGIDMSYKKSGKSVKILNQVNGDMQLVNYTSLFDKYVAEYQKGDDKSFIAWYSEDDGYSSSVSLDLSGDVAYVYDYLGNLIETIDNPSGGRTFTITNKPILIKCVTNGIDIDKAYYNPSKNLLTVKGTTELSDAVTVTLFKGEDAIKTSTVTNVAGKWENTVTVKDAGIYTIKVADASGTIYDTKQINIEPASVVTNSAVPQTHINTATVAYNSENRKIGVSGTVSGSSNAPVSVALIKKNADKENIKNTDIAYLGELKQSVSNYAYVNADWNMQKFNFNNNQAISTGKINVKFDFCNVDGETEEFYKLIATDPVNSISLLTVTTGGRLKFASWSNHNDWTREINPSRTIAQGVWYTYEAELDLDNATADVKVTEKANGKLFGAASFALAKGTLDQYHSGWPKEGTSFNGFGTQRSLGNGLDNIEIIIADSNILASFDFDSTSPLVLPGGTTIRTNDAGGITDRYATAFEMPHGLVGEYEVVVGSRNANNVMSNDILPSYVTVGSISGATAESQASATAVMSNLRAISLSATLIIVQLNGNEAIVAVDSKPYEIPANTVPTAYTITADKDKDAVSYKAFVWDSLSGMRPLTGKCEW